MIQECLVKNTVLSVQSRKTAECVHRVVTISGIYLLLETATQLLCNPLVKKHATSDQQHDMLHFRGIGQDEFDRHIAYYILKEASTHPPLRKKRLLTLSKKKTT